MPYGWHQIGATSLSNGEKAAGAGAGAWQVAYQAGGRPSGGNVLSFNLSPPFVFAETGGLSSTEQEAISYDALKDSFLPV
ncbi:MAG TPA: hypothetical protein VHY58_00315, partial [Streptosporangiaceae bacterium]|nr:hypothetical protein [Streptosporangiaceae bacterium]